MAIQIPPKVLAIAGGAAAIGAFALVGGLIGPALVQAAAASEPTIIKTIAPALPAPPGTALDDTRLLKRNGDYYAVEAEPGYSLEPTSEITIKKIGYGTTSFVTVVTTASGTYSSDALASSNVRYPGIHSEQVRLFFPPYGSVFAWSKLTGWTSIPLLDAHSFGYLDADAATASAAGVCVKDTATGICR